ncbi:hypothetical protein [Acetobacter fallax]|uniref:Uncharacterized protein n=1 Tax=Acetobacter fallax TaxID=1737473 RepID=A0ABX0KCN3_9PROT|nr:hypothetical protein [Acetobacter fallax]NHO33563.1 hypothetical protein [Acetobacter fallax]NHO36532.1 hypothetical protein [Acetobacter fallax]
MFVIESWPDGGRGPRICASAEARILVDIMTPFTDMVVWGRRVPETWAADIAGMRDVSAGFSLNGALDQVLMRMREPDGLQGSWPGFLSDDVEQIVALTGALGISREVSVSLRPVASGVAAMAPLTGKLRAICCYGAGSGEWRSGNEMRGSLSPGEIAFLKPSVLAPLETGFMATDPRCFGLSVDVE